MAASKYIVLSLLLIPLSLFAAKPQKGKITVEQQQQFRYYWYAAREALENKDYPRALVLLEFCDAIKPNDGQTLTYIGALYEGMGKKEQALETFRKAFEADPRDSWYRYANALMAQNTPESERQALKVLEQALKSQEARVESGESRVDEDLLELLMRLYGADKQWKKALSMQDRLDAIRGFNAYSAVNRYRIYALWNKPKKALAVLDKYLEQDPTNLQFILYRIELLELTKAKPAELYAAYDQVLAIQPGHLGILNNYAYHLATHKGDLQKAERMSQITIREDPDNPVYLDTYGWILHLKGQDELAKFYLNRALIHAHETNQDEIKKHLHSIK